MAQFFGLLQPRTHLVDNKVVCSVFAGGGLGIYQLVINRHFIPSVVGGHEHDRFNRVLSSHNRLERVDQFLRQTGGPRRVVSRHTEFDGDPHGSSYALSATIPAIPPKLQQSYPGLQRLSKGPEPRGSPPSACRICLRVPAGRRRGSARGVRVGCQHFAQCRDSSPRTRLECPETQWPERSVRRTVDRSVNTASEMPHQLPLQRDAGQPAGLSC